MAYPARLFVRTIPTSLNLLAAAAGIALVLKVFVLNQIPEPVVGFASLGLAAEGLLASVLASYVFYILIVHVKEWRDRRSVYPHIAKWVKAVVGECRQQLRSHGTAAGVSLELATLTEEQVAVAFKAIDPRTNAPLLLGTTYATWYQYWLYHRNSTRQRIAQVFAQLLYLDAEVVALLAEINDCSHFGVVETVAGLQFGNSDAEAFAGTFFKYCQSCAKLDAYTQENAWYAGDAG